MSDLKMLKKVAKAHGYTVELSRRGGHWIFRKASPMFVDEL